MSTLAELVVKLVGDISGFTKSLKDAEQAAATAESGILGRLNAGLDKLAVVAAGATAAGLAAAGAAAVGLGKAAFDAAMQLDKARDIIQIGTGATGKILEGLQADFKAVFANLPVSASDAAQAIAELNTKLGLTGQPLQDVARAMLRMQSLLGGDVLAYSQKFGRVVGDWGIPLEQSVNVLDKFFVASQATGIGVDRLMESLVQFGAPLRLMGFSLDQSIAMLAKWEKEGVNTELVLGSLRIAAGKFAEAGIPLQEGLRGVIEQIRNVEDSSTALSLAMETFGAKAGPDMAAAIIEGRFAIDDMVAALQSAQGAIASTAEATADFPEKMAMLQNKVAIALEPLGAAVIDAFGKVADAILPLADVWLPKLSAAMIPIVERIGEAFASLVDWVVANWPTIELVFGQVVNAVAAILEKTALPMLRLLLDVASQVVSWFEENWPLIQKTAEAVGNALRDVFAVLGPILETLIGGTFATIKATVEGAMGFILNVVKAVMQALTGDWAGAWESVKAALMSAWEGIKGFMSGLPGAMLKLGRDLIQGLISGLRQISIKDALLSLFPPALRALAHQLGIASPSRLAEWYGEMFVQGLVAGLSSGEPKLALQGIAGDLAAGLTPSAPRAGPAGPVSLTLNFYGRADPEQVREATVQALRKAGFTITP